VLTASNTTIGSVTHEASSTEKSMDVSNVAAMVAGSVASMEVHNARYIPVQNTPKQCHDDYVCASTTWKIYSTELCDNKNQFFPLL
jgi:hypothetical protein